MARVSPIKSNQSPSKLQQIMTICQGMTMEELREVNVNVVAQIRNLNTRKQMTAAAAFEPNQLATFYCNKQFRQVAIRIERVNLKSITGWEVDSHGGRTSMRWRVAPSLLTPC